MGIGRREFLSLFGSTLAALAVLPTPAVALEDDLYLNRKLGLAFRKPRGWHFADVRNMGVMAKGQLLTIDGEELHAELRDLWNSAEALPLVTVTQTPLGADARVFTPGISAFVEPLVPGEGGPLAVAEEDLTAMYRLLRQVEVISHSVASNVSHSPAAEYRIAFLFEHEGLAAPTTVRMRALHIHQDARRYTFRMYDARNQAVAFDPFIQGIRIL